MYYNSLVPLVLVWLCWYIWGGGRRRGALRRVGGQRREDEDDEDEVEVHVNEVNLTMYGIWYHFDPENYTDSVLVLFLLFGFFLRNWYRVRPPCSPFVHGGVLNQ